MEVEEEPLLPLMRNRRSKTRSRPPRIPSTLPTPVAKDKTLQVQADKVQSWGPSPEAARRLAKLRRKTDDTSHYYIIMAEVGVLLICLVLLFLCVTHPKWFHYQVTRVYAYMGHAHAQHLVNKSPFSSSSSSSTPLVPSPLPFTLIIPLITLIAITLSAICFAMW